MTTRGRVHWSLFSSGAFALEPVLALDAPITGLTSNSLRGIWVIVLRNIRGDVAIDRDDGDVLVCKIGRNHCSEPGDAYRNSCKICCDSPLWIIFWSQYSGHSRVGFPLCS